MKLKPLSRAIFASVLSLMGALSLSIPIRLLATGGAAPPAVVLPDLATKGQEFFAMSCSQCHGDDALGDEGPNLHNLAVSNRRIEHVIKKGIQGEMPPFENKYDDQQVAALVAYLRTLN